MPIVPSTRQPAQCPYCYEGTIAYDKHSDSFYCNRCNNQVKMENYDK